MSEEFEALDLSGSGGARQGSPALTLLLPLARSRYIVVIGFALGATFGLLDGLMRPNQYESRGSLQVRLSETESAATTDLTNTESRTVALNRQDINAEVELLKSPEVTEQLVDAVGVPRIMMPYDPAANDSPQTPFLTRKLHEFQSWGFANKYRQFQMDWDPSTEVGKRLRRQAIDLVSKNLQLFAPMASKNIWISYATHDPALAQEVVEAFIDAAIAHHNATYSPAAKLDNLRIGVENQRKAWQDAAKEVSDFRSEYKIYDAETQQKGLLAQISSKENEQQDLDRQIAGLGERVKTREAQIAKIDKTHTVPGVPRETPNPTWTAKNNELEKLRTRLADLSDLSEQSQTVVDLKKQITAFETELKKIDPLITVAAVPHEEPNPRYLSLAEKIEDDQAALSALSLELDTVTRQLSEARDRMGVLESNSPMLEDLVRKEANLLAQYQNYDLAYKEQLADTQIFEKSKVSNLLVMQDATFSDKKVGPNRFKYLIFGGGLGFLLGAMIAYLRWALDRTIRHPDQIERMLDIPVLYVIPESRRWRRILRRS